MTKFDLVDLSDQPNDDDDLSGPAKIIAYGAVGIFVLCVLAVVVALTVKFVAWIVL